MTPSAADYASQVHINASPERVFDTLTTLASFASWWAPAADSGAGEVHVSFAGLDDPLVFRVEEAERPSRLRWIVTSCPFLPDWVGTTPAFTLSPSGPDGCDLAFRHQGLHSDLDCFEACRAGWDRYLPSLRDYLETGTGNPFGGAPRMAR